MRKISRSSMRSGYLFRGRKISRKIQIRERKLPTREKYVLNSNRLGLFNSLQIDAIGQLVALMAPTYLIISELLAW